MDQWLLSLAASPWVYPGMFVFALVDGFFPPMPSEVGLLGLVSLAVAGGYPQLAPILLVAGVGAFVGDLIAYRIGARVDIHQLPGLRGGRGKRALARAESSLARRGPSWILAGRFLPVVRVAINASAGALNYPPRKFTALAATGSALWVTYSTIIGVGAGAWLADRPTAAVAVGVVGGTAIGVGLDLALTHVERRRRRTAGRSGAQTAGPHADTNG
jgi:membrane-associated protein